MTVYFVGSEFEALDRGGSANTETTTAAAYDSAFGRAAALMSTSVTYNHNHGTNLTDAWFHFHLGMGSSSAGTGRTPFIIKDSGGNAFVRLLCGTATMKLQYWNGSAWTDVGSGTTSAISSSTKYTIDIHVKVGTGNGVAAWYKNGSLVDSSSTLNLNAYSNFRSLDTLSPATGGTTGFSQYVVSDTSTVGYNLFTAPPSATGTDTGGTGLYTTANETALSDATYIEFAASGDKRSFTFATVSPTKSVQGFTVAGRLMRVDATGPQQAKPYVLVSGTRYYGTTFALTTSFANYQYTWATNPGTGVGWTASDFSTGFEYGWEAVT